MYKKNGTRSSKAAGYKTEEIEKMDGKKRVKVTVIVKGTNRRGIILTPGERLEKTLQRIVSQGEPIPAEIGVGAIEEGKNYEIRYDKHEAMMDAKSKVVQMGIDGRQKEAEAREKANAEAAAKKASGGDENVV